jgi:hypothetical protein
MKKRINHLYKAVCIITSVVFIFSFLQHLFNSDSFISDLGFQSSETTTFLVHRLTIFPIGLAFLIFLLRNLSFSKVRQIVCISIGILLLGIAFIGSFELFSGTVNNYILIPIVLEIG